MKPEGGFVLYLTHGSKDLELWQVGVVKREVKGDRDGKEDREGEGDGVGLKKTNGEGIAWEFIKVGREMCGLCEMTLYSKSYRAEAVWLSFLSSCLGRYCREMPNRTALFRFVKSSIRFWQFSKMAASIFQLSISAGCNLSMTAINYPGGFRVER